MKKLLFILALAALLLCLTSCRERVGPDPIQNSTAASETASPVVSTVALETEGSPEPTETEPVEIDPGAPVPTLPETIEAGEDAQGRVQLGFQWTDVYEEAADQEVDVSAMDGEEFFRWYEENGTFWRFTNQKGEVLEINPWGPESTGRTTMEILNGSDVTGNNPWEFYSVPYSPAFRFAATRDDRPCSCSVAWEDQSIQVRGEHTGDLRFTVQGLYMAGSSYAYRVTQPMNYQVTLRRFDSSRELIVTGENSAAFLLTRDGNRYTVTASHECQVALQGRDESGAAKELKVETVPAGACWYVEDLNAPEEGLKTGLEE
ncbi:MAG: hypothetical protein IKS05_00570 [Oscillospiraceae bacterium]|nr:hypothetical protein [Oscillospiraceae bacterium]